MQGFSATQISELSVDALGIFTPNQIKQLPAEAIKGLSPEQVSELSSKAVKGFTSDQMEQMPKQTFEALNLTQLSKLNKDALTGHAFRLARLFCAGLGCFSSTCCASSVDSGEIVAILTRLLLKFGGAAPVSGLFMGLFFGFGGRFFLSDDHF